MQLQQVSGERGVARAPREVREGVGAKKDAQRALQPVRVPAGAACYWHLEGGIECVFIRHRNGEADKKYVTN